MADTFLLETSPYGATGPVRLVRWILDPSNFVPERMKQELWAEKSNVLEHQNFPRDLVIAEQV